MSLMYYFGVDESRGRDWLYSKLSCCDDSDEDVEKPQQNADKDQNTASGRRRDKRREVLTDKLELQAAVTPVDDTVVYSSEERLRRSANDNATIGM